MKERIHFSKKTWILLIAVTIIAFLFFLNGLNEPHVSPFEQNLKLNSPTAAALSKDGGAIVDSKGHRLIILDDKLQVSKIVDMTKSGSPMDVIHQLAIYEDTIYCVGGKSINQGCYYTEEKVVSYDFKGNKKADLYQIQYGEDEVVSSPQIQNITVCTDGIFLLRYQNRELSLIKLENGEENVLTTIPSDEAIYYSAYLWDQDMIICEGINLDCWGFNLQNHSMSKLSENQLISLIFPEWMTQWGEMEKDTSFSRLNTIYDQNGNRKSITYLDLLKTEMKIFQDGQVEALSQDLPFDSWFFLGEWLYWFLLVWLIALVIGILCWLFVFKLKKKGKLCLGIIFLCLLVSAFYTYNAFSQIEQEYERQLKSQSNQFEIIISDFLTENGVSNLTNEMHALLEKKENHGKLIKIQNKIGQLCAGNGLDRGIFSEFILVENGKSILILDSRGTSPPGIDYSQRLNDADILDAIQKNESIIYVSTSFYNQMAAYTPIYNEKGELIAFILTSCFEDNLIATQTSNALDLFINLAAIFVTLFVSLSAFKELGKDFKIFKKMRADHDPESAVMLNGSYQMLFKLMTIMDMALQVYIAESLCVNASAGEIATLVAIPSATFFAGMWIGSLVYPIMHRKLGNRWTGILGCVGCIIAYGMMITSIGLSSLMIYSAAKLLQGLFAQGILFMLGDNIPFISKNQNTRDRSIVSSTSAGLAASVIATLLGGYIGQYLSYTALYIVIACLAVGMLFLCVLIFGGNTGEEKLKEAENTGSSLKSWLAFLKPTMLIYIFCFVVPKTLIGGYNTYLFPLYTSTAGISAVLLSNITVFSTTFSYLTNEPLNRFCDRFDRVKVMVTAVIIISVSFMGFILAPNIYWAIAVLFIFTSMNQIAFVGNKIYLADYSLSVGEDPAEIQTDFNIISSFISIGNSPILSGFVNFAGCDLGCALVGVVCGVLSGIFGLFNKQQKKKTT